MVLSELIAGGVAVDLTDKRFLRTPCSVAAATGRSDAVALLHSQGANLNHRDRHGISPLELASWKGHPGTVGLLLANGADPKAKDNFGISPLYKAAAFGHSDVIKELAKHPDQSEDIERALRIVSMRGHVRVAKELLRMPGVDPNRPDDDGCTALHYGCQEEGVVDTLLKAGADPCALCKGKSAFELCEDPALALVLKQAYETRSNQDGSNRSLFGTQQWESSNVNESSGQPVPKPVDTGHPSLETIETQQGTKYHAERASRQGTVQERSLIYKGPLNE